MLILQIIVQDEALFSQMLADNGHGEIAAILAAEFSWQGEAIVTCCIGTLTGLPQ